MPNCCSILCTRLFRNRGMQVICSSCMGLPLFCVQWHGNGICLRLVFKRVSMGYLLVYLSITFFRLKLAMLLALAYAQGEIASRLRLLPSLSLYYAFSICFVLFFFCFFGAVVYMHTVIRSAVIFPLVFGGIVMLFFVLRRIDLSWLQKHKQHWNMIWKSRRFVPIVVAVVFSWICEAVVLFEMAKMVAFPLSFAQSLWVNSMTVGGQIFQMTPGGLATYEAVMAFALTRIHPYWEQAYALALVTHLFKFLFSYVVGLYVWFRIPTLWTFVRKEDAA